MGLLSEGISEVIATTRLNAAPMGIRYANGEYSMILFAGSHTAANVERDGWIVANLIFDPVLYVRTAFEDLDKNAFVDEEVNGRTMCRLADAEAWAAFGATIGKKTADAMKVRLTLEKGHAGTVRLHPVNRGFNSIIDATVHATRYRVSRDPALKTLIDYDAIIVQKCGGPREREALEMLMRYIS